MSTRSFLSWLLILIGLGTGVAWAISFPEPFTWLAYINDGLCLEVTVYDGECALLMLAKAPEVPVHAFKYFINSQAEDRVELMAFGFEPDMQPTSGRWPWGFSVRGFVFPLWYAAAGALAFPIIARIRSVLRQRRRLRRGLCLRCGYNLTGNTTGRCPECATAVGEPTGPSPRMRRIGKLAGLWTCSFIALLMVLSPWGLCYRLGAWNITVYRGGLTLDWVTIARGPHRTVTISPFVPRSHGDVEGGITRDVPVHWWFQYRRQARGEAGAFHVPLWVPLLAIGLPTAWIWRRDRAG